jgi:hypothetical protein
VPEVLREKLRMFDSMKLKIQNDAPDAQSPKKEAPPTPKPGGSV